MLKKLHIYLLLIAYCFTANAQTYPVTISTQLTQPSPIYLSNYANATTLNSPIKVQLILNDLTIMNRQVRLKCYFSGSGASFVSKDYVIGTQPLYLEGGFPTQLTNVELAPYFEFNNIQGINPNQYAQPLPEGIYTISFEVYDFATNKKLSKKSSVTTIIFQNEPPFLNLPANKAGIMEQNIQNIIFSWTPRSINVSNVEYEFSLVEIWNSNTPIQNAFAYSPPLYTTTTRNTTLQYSIMEPQLIPGKTYAWRVKAKALLGAEEIGVFKNNGFSETYSFKYLTFCKPPQAITTTDVSQEQVKVTWSGAVDNYDYQVNYREKNADSKWYKLVTPREYILISNLKPKTTYEYTVGAACDLGEYTHSNIQEFTTLTQDEIAFTGCGIKPDPTVLSNKTPLPALFPNDVVTAGDFPIVVLKSTGSNGTFSGEGYVTLPFLEKFRKLIDAAAAMAGSDEKGDSKANIGKYTRIRITFNNIGVNTDFKLISGEIVASYDPKWGSMVDGDPILNPVIDAIGDLFEQLFTKADKLEEQKSLGLISDQEYKKELETVWNDIKKADEQYKALIKTTDLPQDLKDKVANLKSPLPAQASNDNTAVKNDFSTQSKEYREKINAVKKEVDAFKIDSEYIYVLPNLKPFRFKDGDGKKSDDVILVDSKNNGGFPNGTLYGFKINNIKYLYKKETQNFEPEYKTDDKATDNKKNFCLIIQSSTNECNYYLVPKKVEKITDKLDLNTLSTKPIVVCENGGKIPLNANQNSAVVIDFATIFKNLKSQQGENAIASEVLILDINDPNYQQKLSDAKKKVSYILATYDSKNTTPLKLEYKLEVPKSLKDMFPDMQFDDKCTAEYINKSLDNLHTSSIYKNCGLSGTKASLEVLTLFYQGYFGFYKCAFGEEKMANQPAGMQFIAGASYCAITTIDVLDLAKGLLEIIKTGSTTYVQSYVDYYKNLAQIKNNLFSGQEVKTKQILGVALLPPYNVAPEAIDKGLKIGETFKDKYFVNCGKLCWYRYGEMSVIAIPIIYTGGEYAVAKVKEIADISKISITLTENVLKLNEKLIAKGVVLEEKAGNTLIKNLEGKVLKEVDGSDFKKVEEALEDVGKLNKITTRILDVVADSKIIDRVKILRQKLTSNYKKSGNFGWAETEVIELSKTEYYAHSGIDELTGTLPDRVPDISLKPKNEIFPYSTELNSAGVPIARNIDTEYKILTEIAEKLNSNINATGKIRLFTERAPCNSCSNVIDFFAKKYPKIKIEIIHNNGNILIN
jgi:hypothetical protein